MSTAAVAVRLPPELVSASKHVCITYRDVEDYRLGNREPATLLSIELRALKYSCCRNIALQAQWGSAFPQPLSAFTSLIG